MGTGADRVNIYLKKFMSQQHMESNFLNYLRQLVLDLMADMYPQEGFFYGGVMSADGNDKFQLSTALLATDGLGHRLSLNPTYASGIQFENALGIEYYVGLRYNDIPELTEINVRSGEIEYSFDQESIGEIADPDAVVDNGTTITLTVDSVTESGVSNAGRKVLVWLKQAVGEVDAFYEGTVIWDGSNNKVTTTHLLGQDVGSVSTTASDYQVFLIGPTVKRNTDLDADPLYAFVGKVTGAGAGNPPSTFNESGKHYIYPASSISFISDEVKSFLTGGGLITWDLSGETLTWADDLVIKIPGKPYNFTISAGSQASFADGECIYITLDDLGGVKAVTKDTIEDISYLPEIYVIALRIGQNMYIKGGLELKGAATDTSGRIHDITQDLLTFMGATDESDNDPSFPSATLPTSVILDGDPLATAINKINTSLAGILANNPVFEEFVVGVGGQSIFNLSAFTVDADNTKLDMIVFVDGRWQIPDILGGLTKSFRKNSTTQFELSETVPEGKTVIAWKQGTSSASGGTDLTNIPVDIQPDTAAARTVGTLAKPWNSLIVKDKANSDIWEIEVDGGVLQATKLN